MDKIRLCDLPDDIQEFFTELLDTLPEIVLVHKVPIGCFPIIGLDVTQGDENGETIRHLSLISMTDGMTQTWYRASSGEKVFFAGCLEKNLTSQDVLAHFLNTCKEEFRFATQDELVRVAVYQTSKTV